MATIKSFLIFIFVTFCCFHSFSLNVRENVVNTFQYEIGVREATGKNDGTRVEQYLRAVRMKKGNPWCAAYVSWSFQQDCVPNPKSAWAPDYFPLDKIIWDRRKDLKQEVKAGDVFGIYFPNKGRIAHVGFILEWGNKTITTIEGNTNEAGSREGDGVYKKFRLKSQIFQVSSWIKN